MQKQQNMQLINVLVSLGKKMLENQFLGRSNQTHCGFIAAAAILQVFNDYNYLRKI